MVTIIKKKGSKGEHYYVYDYEKDIKTGKFKRKYVGTTTKEKYDAYIKTLDDRFKYCKVCGKKKQRFAEHSDFCKCNNGKNMSSMRNEVH